MTSDEVMPTHYRATICRKTAHMSWGISDKDSLPCYFPYWWLYVQDAWISFYTPTGHIMLWLSPSLSVLFACLFEFPSIRRHPFLWSISKTVWQLSIWNLICSFPISSHNAYWFQRCNLDFECHWGQICFPEVNSKSIRAINLKLGTYTCLGSG